MIHTDPQGTATLNVTSSAAAANLTAITVSPAALSLPVNTARQFTATGSYNDGSSRDLTGLVAWNSSSTTAATVDVNGLATGLAAGTRPPSQPRSMASPARLY